jgi:regulator of protease activity HflC (stomatin/prohibitin superfamily)
MTPVPESRIPFIAKIAGVSAVSLFFIALFIAGCNSISPGYVGVEVNKAGSARGVDSVALKTGYIIVNPFLTSVIEYPTFIQTAKWTRSASEGTANDDSITFTSKDAMVVNADISISYELKFEKVPEFYVKFRADHIENFTDGFLRNITRDEINNVAGKYSVEQIMGDNGPIFQQVRDNLQKQLDPYGVVIDQLGVMGAPRPPANVIDAINSKVQAAQIALQKQNEVLQAEADAKKQVAEAQGQADANVVQAKGDSEANRLRQMSLTPGLIQLKAIEKWNGQLPQVQTGSQSILSIPTPGK